MVAMTIFCTTASLTIYLIFLKRALAVEKSSGKEIKWVQDPSNPKRYIKKFIEESEKDETVALENVAFELPGNAIIESETV
ncbi:Oidioi.mRNA.OKI2018_I69.chr2.g5871.t1.cds [Oikopleura dioica]|uniref:Oidioi.mRNA.OKI2018_I69.chr2.g5871.t1.cds n=1 Tax=Oikopleura dioica TaxID=34765 RepID=A0ABN7TAQ8_OIKDI|nr:Oidioi.mRNA.OKI2018_I69.chr2.g5871.t1.cds [Oikopleura dioica]